MGFWRLVLRWVFGLRLLRLPRWRWRGRRSVLWGLSPRLAYNLVLLGFTGALGLGWLALEFYVAPPPLAARLSAQAVAAPLQLASWRNSPPSNRWQRTRRLGSGESLAEFLQRQHISDEDAAGALAALRGHAQMRPQMWDALAGQELTLWFAAEKNEHDATADKMADATTGEAERARFDGLMLELPQAHWLVQRGGARGLVQRGGAQVWQVQRLAKTLQTRLQLAEGTLGSDFYAAARRAGLPPRLTRRFLRLAQTRPNWQAQDWRGGELQVIYERYFDGDGVWLRDGEIIFFSLQQPGEAHEFWRFVPAGGAAGYFDANNASLVRAPLRVLSGSDARRFAQMREAQSKDFSVLIATARSR